MNEWIDNKITAEIVEINSNIKEDNFSLLASMHHFHENTPENIRRAILEYFDDTPEPSNLNKICAPSEKYILEKSRIYFINPKQPNQKERRIELNAIIEGKESDLTIVYFSYKDGRTPCIQIYDALTL